MLYTLHGFRWCPGMVCKDHCFWSAYFEKLRIISSVTKTSGVQQLFEVYFLQYLFSGLWYLLEIFRLEGACEDLQEYNNFTYLHLFFYCFFIEKNEISHFFYLAQLLKRLLRYRAEMKIQDCGLVAILDIQ